MTNYNVYQPFLSNEQYDQVNSEGWRACEFGTTYLDLTGFPRKETVNDLVLDACDHRLYTHAWSVDGNNLETVFAATNGVDYDGVVVKRVGDRQKSGSVGDVVIDGLSERGWVCMPIGWIQLDPKTVREFQTRVSTWVGDH